MEAHSGTGRKKQPEQVRARLLAATAELAALGGLAAVTLDAVSARAGVSKGGLLHHFRSRKELIRGLATQVTERLREQVHALMAADSEPHGRFSRAYIRAALNPAGFDGRLLAALSLAFMEAVDVSAIWNDWVKQELAHAPERENSAGCWAARLGADGLWLAESSGGTAPHGEDRERLIERLCALCGE